MDLLVKLYDLPDSTVALKKLRKRGIEIRRALAPEKTLVTDWVRKTFSSAWANECDVIRAHCSASPATMQPARTFSALLELIRLIAERASELRYCW